MSRAALPDRATLARMMRDPEKAGFRLFQVRFAGEGEPDPLRLDLSGVVTARDGSYRGELRAVVHPVADAPRAFGADTVLRTAFPLLWDGRHAQIAAELAARLRVRDSASLFDAALDSLSEYALEELRTERDAVDITIVKAHGDIEYDVHRIFPRHRMVVVYAAGAVGKTTLASGWAVSCATGIEIVPGFIPTRRMRVGILDYDEGPEEHGVRINAIAAGHGVTIDPGWISYRSAVQPIARIAGELGRWVHDAALDLLIIDPAMQALRGAEGGDPAEPIRELKEWVGDVGVTVILLDHVNANQIDNGKSDRPYGSVYKSNTSRGTFKVTLGSSKPGQREVRFEGSKSLALRAPIEPIDIRITYTPAEPPYETIVFSPTLILDAAGVEPHGVKPSVVRAGFRVARALSLSPHVASKDLHWYAGLPKSQAARGLTELRRPDSGWRIKTVQHGPNPATYELEPDTLPLGQLYPDGDDDE